MGDTLDLLVIGGYYGEGERARGGVSHFLLGLKAPETEKLKFGAHTDHPLFYPFCKVEWPPHVSSRCTARARHGPVAPAARWARATRSSVSSSYARSSRPRSTSGISTRGRRTFVAGFRTRRTTSRTFGTRCVRHDAMHASGSRQPSVVNAARDELSPHQLVNALTLAPCALSRPSPF